MGAELQAERLGIVMRPDARDPNEAWGVLNPGGVRGPDDAYYLFPRQVAQGNYSRIGRARVTFSQDGRPRDVTRLGIALEPQEAYERSPSGGGVEDPRVTYVEPLGSYVMAYTAYTPQAPRIALAVSRDLVTWRRLGPLRFATVGYSFDLNICGNKDGLLFPDVVLDPQGKPALAIVHRPTHAIRHHGGTPVLVAPPSGAEELEQIWISYAPLDRALADISTLVEAGQHEHLLGPQADWEQRKIGGGAPPVRLPYGWLFIYHGVSAPTAGEGKLRYCAGAVILDLERPTRVLYRSPLPILEPTLPEETTGIVPGVVFPTATDRPDEDHLDIYYGAADSVIGVARMRVPRSLPATSSVAPS